VFEGGCAVILVRDGPRPVRCPEDRRVLRAFNEHRLLSQIYEEYLDRFPAEKREEDNLAAMDLLYIPGQRVSFECSNSGEMPDKLKIL